MRQSTTSLMCWPGNEIIVMDTLWWTTSRSFSGFRSQWSRTHCCTAGWWSPQPGTSYLYGYPQIQATTVDILTTWALDMGLLSIGITSPMREGLTGSCPLLVVDTQPVSLPLCGLNYDVRLTYNEIFSTSSPALLLCFTRGLSEACSKGARSLAGAKDMSTQIVFAVLCLWRGGIHSLQGLPSILLLKQWLCTQPIQGRENATQRDGNVKHLAIWGERAPNNDSWVITEALFWFLSLSFWKPPLQKLKIKGKCLISIHVSVTLDRFSVAPLKESKFWFLTMWGQKKKKVPIHRRRLIQRRPLSHTQVTSNAIYFLLAFVSTRAGLSPYLTKTRH